MNFNEIVDVIQKLGFPIVVAVWFMFRTDKRLDKVLSIMEQILAKIDLIEDEEQ